MKKHTILLALTAIVLLSASFVADQTKPSNGLWLQPQPILTLQYVTKQMSQRKSATCAMVPGINLADIVEVTENM